MLGSQHFYKGGHDHGGTEGPERGAERRAGWGLPSMGSGGVPPENFRKINVEIAHFLLVLPARYHSKVNRWYYYSTVVCRSVRLSRQLLQRQVDLFAADHHFT